MSDIEGFILTGGASSRMGRDKSRLRLQNKTFVERAAHALSAVTSRTRIVSARPGDAQAGLHVISDIHRNCGALGGLHAALVHADSPWIAVVSCDLPFVTGELFALLAAFRSEQFAAVAPQQADGRPQPLCALYARGPCLRAAEQLLNSGELRPRVLLHTVNTRWAMPAEWQPLAQSPLFFCNVNAPEDYAQALTIADCGLRIAE